MTIVGLSKITSKGQVTLPKGVRDLLKLKRGATIAFGVSRNGVVISRCSMTLEKTNFTKAEWQKIERLAAAKGKAYSTAQEAKEHLNDL